MPIHQHEYSDPGHKHEDAGHDHDFTPMRFAFGGEFFHRGRYAGIETETSKTGYANIQSSKTGISIGNPISAVPLGNEVRPKNMIVQWIIKIY